MLQDININNLLIIDIETVPFAKSFDELNNYEQELWEEKKGKHRNEDENKSEFYFNNAGILAEFGKIVCISIATITNDGLFKQIKCNSFYGDDEKQVLIQFQAYLEKVFAQNSRTLLCGHNIKEFDIPYICRRLLINEMQLSSPLLNLQSKKPWEVALVDTMDQWKFGDYKNYISLKLLAYLLKVPSPKDDISGKDVGRVYWQENGLERIKKYCEKDVATVAQIVLKLKADDLIDGNNIIFS
ncbi:MAG: ribonuclease H-like domain-containing protein [Chitinophagales bacterium]|nr:ribonuclease H-like domain-containing protein [Chitinophagales bacterium]